MKKLNILGKDHDLIYRKLKGAYGYCHKGDNKIEIDKSLMGDDHDQTLLHEMFHAALFRIGLDRELNSVVEEILVETLAHVVIDNFIIKPRGDTHE